MAQLPTRLQRGSAAGPLLFVARRESTVVASLMITDHLAQLGHVTPIVLPKLQHHLDAVPMSSSCGTKVHLEPDTLLLQQWLLGRNNRRCIENVPAASRMRCREPQRLTMYLCARVRGPVEYTKKAVFAIVQNPRVAPTSCMSLRGDARVCSGVWLWVARPAAPAQHEGDAKLATLEITH